MKGADKWIWGGLLGLFSILALVVAANGGPGEPVAYYGGLGFALFCVLLILYIIKDIFDRPGHGLH